MSIDPIVVAQKFQHLPIETFYTLVLITIEDPQKRLLY